VPAAGRMARARHPPVRRHATPAARGVNGVERDAVRRTSGLKALLARLAADMRLRYLVVGAGNTVFGYLCFVAVHLLAGARLGTLATLVLAYAIALPVTFLAQRGLVFRQGGALAPQALRFAIANTSIFVANLVVVPLLVDRLGWEPLRVQLGFVAASTVLSYLAHKHWSFAR
jgi:putative flippase GtrA